VENSPNSGAIIKQILEKRDNPQVQAMFPELIAASAVVDTANAIFIAEMTEFDHVRDVYFKLLTKTERARKYLNAALSKQADCYLREAKRCVKEG
jgi:hypothetical protein